MNYAPPKLLAVAMVLTALWFSRGVDGAARETNAPPAHLDFPSFKLIVERNIFNSNRSRRGSRGGGSEAKKAPKAETVTLVGTLSYDDERFAFFDGSSSEFKKVLEPGKTIAGHKLMEVNANSVRLDAGTNQVELRVGMELRREEAGEWEVSGDAGTKPVASSSGASDTAGNESDIIKKLMQQREQELK